MRLINHSSLKSAETQISITSIIFNSVLAILLLGIVQARLDILRIHSRKMNLTRGINLRKVAETMPGSSGAEVKGVCTEAGMYALRERRVHVTQEDFEMAVAKVKL